MNYRSLNDLFGISQTRADSITYEVKVQMIEIYNEQVRDLLMTDGTNRRYPFMMNRLYLYLFFNKDNNMNKFETLPPFDAYEIHYYKLFLHFFCFTVIGVFHACFFRISLTIKHIRDTQ